MKKIRVTHFLTAVIACVSSFLSENVSAGKMYTGTATPIVKETIASGSDADYYGTVKHVAKRGSLITPRISNMKGETVVPGTVVMQQGTTYWQAIVDGDKASVAAADEDIKTAKINLSRFHELVDSKAESVEKYQYYINDYYRYLGDYIQAKGNLLLSEEVLNTRTMLAPFEGYVDDVLYTMGRASNNPPTVKITQLNPIGIKVKMSRDEARKINAMTPVTIYLPETNTPQGIFNGFSILCNDGIVFLTENYPKTTKNSMSKEVKFELDNFLYVDYFYIDNPQSKMLCIPTNALQKDNAGYYVWRAKDRQFLVPGQIFNPIFQLEKVYISPGNLQRLFLGYVHVRSLKNPGKLRFKDVILSSPPKELQEGDTVAFKTQRYIIMPNETVKVEIGQ